MTTRDKLKLKKGGLMRCCTVSFEAWVHRDPKAEAVPEELIVCAYENRPTMRVDKNGTAVEWTGDQP